MSKPVVALVVAGGVGRRFGARVPKQNLRLGGRAILVLAVEQLASAGCTDAVVVTNAELPRAIKTALRELPITVGTTPGGATRQESVQCGLKLIRDDPRLATAEVILIHDAVRPMMPASVVQQVIQAVRDGSVAVAPALPVNDSIRAVEGADEQRNTAVDRSLLRAIQTPQGFRPDVIQDSHRQAAVEGWTVTDDVTTCELNGHLVRLVPGSRLGMKITEPSDLVIAKALWRLSQQAEN